MEIAANKSMSKKVPYEFIKNFLMICHPGSFNMYEKLGVRWCRADFTWDRVESSEDKINLAWLDDMLFKAIKYGITVMPILCYCARWASICPKGAFIEDPHHFPPRETAYWENYVKTIVSKYSSLPYNLKYYEIWNEPNIEVFWKVDWEKYIDEILIPAAKVIHKYNCFVVAPSVTLEHFGYSSFVSEFMQRWNLENCRERIDEWLSYHEAYKYIDILSIHYSKGDTGEEKGKNTSNLMPFYNHIYDKWIKPGKIKGIWNTEEGLTAEHPPGEKATLEKWEEAPYGQWVPRYIIPVISWAIEHNWDFKDKYKVCWYEITTNPSGVLYPTALINNEKLEIKEVGMALRTLAKEIFTGNTLIYKDYEVLNEKEEEVVSYGFKIDNKLIIATWVDKGVETVTFTIKGLDRKNCQSLRVCKIDYLSGKRSAITQLEWIFKDKNDFLRVSVAADKQPVIYLEIREFIYLPKDIPQIERRAFSG